jgi:hypothetical protein
MPVTKLYLISVLQSHDHTRPGPDRSGKDEPVADRREESYSREIREVQSELAGLRSELRRFIEHTNRQHVDAALSGIRREYADVFIEQALSDADQRLRERMIGTARCARGVIPRSTSFSGPPRSISGTGR